MKLQRTLARVLGLTALACAVVSCSSVKAPEVFEYRLAWPRPTHQVDPAIAAETFTGTLRVGEVQVAAPLEGDRLRVATGPVRFQSYELHRWAAPLDRMVGDVLVAGLARSRAFDSVLTAGDDGFEDYVLSGRLLELEQAADRDGDGWIGVATLELRLRQVSSGAVVFEEEFRCERSLDGDGPEALVTALSGAIGSVVDDVVARCDRAGVFSGEPLDPTTFAAPGR